MTYLSVSTWSLHRLLGPLRWTVWDSEQKSQKNAIDPQPEQLTLLDLPAEAARRGFQAVEICHFHFPSTEPEYLQQLKEAFASAQISFDTLLLDYGDLTSSDEARVQSDLAYVRQWIRTASIAGAKKIRVIAGEAPATDEEAIRTSAERLSQLSEEAAAQGVQLITENFMALTSTGDSCMKLLELAEHKFGMITDFGNFQGERKYEELLMTLPYSVSVHAKAEYDERGYPDEREFERCLEMVRQSGYDGSIVVIYDGPGDMWEGIERVKRIIESYFR